MQRLGAGTGPEAGREQGVKTTPTPLPQSCSPVVKKLPPSTGDVGSIPGWGTKIPHSRGQLGAHVATTEPAHHD